MRATADPIVIDDGRALPELPADVLRGLSMESKRLPSRYLYDERGARLFERICELDEYYIPHIEPGILREALPELAERLGPRVLAFEPGSGAGRQTRLLLRGLVEPAAYIPIDISREQLVVSAAALAREFPAVDILPVCADFLCEFDLPAVSRRVDRTVAFFPGSTIGNLIPAEAIQLLRRLRSHCGARGAVLVGVDLQKAASVLLRAYNDSAGISAEFALNALVRLNRETGAGFDLAGFEYSARYNAHLGRVEMGLVSRCAQSVKICGRSISFEAGEFVSTEVSYKYTLETFAALAACAGLGVGRVWTDPQGWFSVQLLLVG